MGSGSVVVCVGKDEALVEIIIDSHQRPICQQSQDLSPFLRNIQRKTQQKPRKPKKNKKKIMDNHENPRKSLTHTRGQFVNNPRIYPPFSGISKEKHNKNPENQRKTKRKSWITMKTQGNH